MKSRTIAGVVLLSIGGGCASDGPLPPPQGVPYVAASAETEPVRSLEDAADDPAIWVHAGDPAKSLILGTDKRSGLHLYDLTGAEKQYLPVGRLNNVDLRQGVTVGEWTGDIAAASNRSDDTVSLFTLTGEGEAAFSGSIASPVVEPYGLCMGSTAGAPLVFVAYKTGELVMFALDGPAGGREIGRLQFATQLEGCVFDDEALILYVGEENRGVWKSALTNGVLGAPDLVDEVGGENGLVADVEGLALYKSGPETGYLVVSSQGDYSYALYEREGDNRFRGRFAIAGDETVDSVEETDGLEASAVAFGAQFPRGVLVVQDGYNETPGQPGVYEAQNYKLVDWREIESALQLTDD